MPHSSSGFGEVKVNRLHLVERESLKETNDKKINLEGQESSPPTTVALVTFLHGQIVGLEDGSIVPVTFRDKAERDGYYIVGNTNSDLVDYQDEVAMASWTIELERVGSASEVDIQSRLTGAVRQNDFALSGNRWHAPAIDHYGYSTGSTNPDGFVTRSGEDGDIKVYHGLPANIHPKWGCAVNDYEKGRVRVHDTLEVTFENEVEGINRNISATGWTLSNGLLSISPTTTAGELNIQYHNGTSYQDNIWNIQAGGSNINQWRSATILRNTFEMCVVRLMADTSTQGRIQLDLTLRRGAYFVEGYLQSTSSTTLKVERASSTLSTSGIGYIVQDTGTHRVVAGSAHTFSSDTSSCGISDTSSTAMDFWSGVVIDAASPTTGNSPTDLRDQYIGTMPEITYVIGR